MEIDADHNYLYKEQKIMGTLAKIDYGALSVLLEQSFLLINLNLNSL